jgi:hypothetical protein
VAKKRQTRPAAKKASSRSPKATRNVASTPRAKTTAKASPKARAAAPARRPAAPPQPTGPSLMELAERLRDEIQRSKHTHPDPWAYGAKARPWGERAQAVVDQIAFSGDTAATRRALEALDGEVQRDRDFQEARRLF